MTGAPPLLPGDVTKFSVVFVQLVAPVNVREDCIPVPKHRIEFAQRRIATFRVHAAYSPTLLNGDPIEVDTTITVNFKLLP